MMSFHSPQKIFVIISLFFVLVLMRLTSESAELKGTVIAVQGDDVTVKIESEGTLQPAVGDILNIMERANEEGNALGIPGKWIITEVNGDIVKAEGKNLLAGLRPRVNMVAFIHISSRSVHAREAPKVKSEQSLPTAKGKVIMTRGNNVTIQLTKEQPAVYKGDAVELSYSVDDIVIPVGKWRISAINKNGTLEAEPIEMEAQPTIDMDALVFTTTPEKAERVKAEPPDTGNNEIVGREGTFVTYANGVVRDKKTGLEWISGSDTEIKFTEAISWVKNLTLGGGDWRMPQPNELATLYVKNRSSRNIIIPLRSKQGWRVWTGKKNNGYCTYYSYHNNQWEGCMGVICGCTARVIAVRNYRYSE